MQSKATTVSQYLRSLPADRREAVSAVRETILANLGKGFEEGIQYGMIGYFVPHSVYPAGYHCDPQQPLPFAGLASQKNHIGLYLMCIYGDEGEESRFREAWTKAGKRLDMGKSCVRFKKLDDVPMDVVARTIKRVSAKQYIARYEAARDGGGERAVRRKASAKAAGRTAKKAVRKKA